MFEAGHVERVIRHLVRFGSSRADAEDLAQEALVIAWRKQGELDPERSLDAWLYGIARNVYRNHARTLRRRAEEPAEPAGTAAGDAVADARALADTVALRDALQALPEAQQDIVILHELEEYTLKETAELLAIPFDTAKDRLRRAREGLRERMHVDLAVAAASERRAASHVAKLAAPAVLVGVLAAVSRTAVAAGAAGAAGAHAGAGAGASAAGAGAAGAHAGASAAGAAGAGAGAAGAGAGAAGAHAGASAAGAGAATGALATSKVALGVALVTGIVVGIVADRVVLRPSDSTSAARAGQRAEVALAAMPTPTPTPTPTPSPTPTPTPSPAVDAGTAADATSVVARPAPPGAATPVAANPEVMLVERARVALRRGIADEAIRTLMSHERKFAGGQLAEERDVLLIEAYLAADNVKLAQQRLAHYRAAYPAGLHAQRAATAAAEIARRTTR